MQTTGILDEGPLPGHGQGQEQGIQARIVEAFADVATGRQNQALPTRRNRRELLRDLAPPPGTPDLPRARRSDDVESMNRPR